MSEHLQPAAPLLEPEAAIDHRHVLVSSRRVEGTAVYNSAEKKLGTIHSVMIDKRTGQVAYAVLSFGGFLGIREHVTPVPWALLAYNVDLDAYVIDLTREQLAAAPSLRLDHADRPQSGTYEDIKGYYEQMRWWGL
jgi:sporulation protein YlmC with PRC-barrel domain